MMTKPKTKKNICVGEEVKIAASLALQKFRLTEDQNELEFPSSFTSTERAFIHSLARSLGLKSKSRGKAANRFLTVYKKDGSTIVQADAEFQLVKTSRQTVVTLLQRFPVTNKERQDLVPLSEKDRLLIDDALARDINKSTGRLNYGIPHIPPPRGNCEYSSIRESLPIFHLRDEIISVIDQHQVVLIAGETGCGKTTQVPQYILDTCYVKNKPCRIVCTQPRRIAALTVAERVAAERDEKIGQTVGYQIRLESRVSPKTLLTFCTNGVLLRTLMGSDATLATVTHVIVDEIHERDRFSDFLLIILRDALAKFRNLKLILMSAALDLQLFLKYFNGCPVVSVPGKLFDVQELFLEDVLRCTGYLSKAMVKYRNEMGRKQMQKRKLTDWCSKVVQNSVKEVSAEDAGQMSENCESNSTEPQVEVPCDNGEIAANLIPEMEKCISEAWLKGTDGNFGQMLYLIIKENVSVDYQHSETGVTPLMVACGRGCVTTVEQLLHLGANVDIRASNDWTALDWARNFNRSDIIEILEAHILACESSYSNMSDLLNKMEGMELGDEEKTLLDIYHHSFDDEKVDLSLILAVLYKILMCQEEGAVLVFLPGYDEIVSIRDRIMFEDKRFADSSRYILFMLHSNMHSFDQKRVFRPAPSGVRKIILSTNISETSITFNDVVFVIDSGKVKEKSFDAIAGVSSLKPVWISKASCLQRMGRAGRCRPGVCYHLFSRLRFKSMQEFQQPEILRVPLQDLCLHTKLLALPNTPIADFLARAPDPPAFMVTRNAVQLLKTIDSLDPWEGLTELGYHLLDFPIDPRLGKMVLHAVILKCLDPVLTIVCTLAYKDPFTLPPRAADKLITASNKKKLAAGTFSDHMTLLRAFQAWQKACNDGWEKAFCDKYFISSSTMEMIVGMRTQLLGQLRASGFVRARGGGDIRDLNCNSDNWCAVKAALVAGTYPNLIRVDRDRMQLITQKESKVRFHPSSVLAEKPQSPKVTVSAAHTETVRSLPTDWLIYEEMTRSEHLAYARCCTLVTPITIAIFGGPSRLPLDAISETVCGTIADEYQGSNSDSEFEEKNEGQKAMLKLDDWISFRIDSEVAHLALQLRQKWHSLFLRRIRTPAKPWSQVDEAVVRSVISVISGEEQNLGLQQPAGIGQRPKPMSTDYLSSTPTGMRRSSVDTENSDDSCSVSADAAHFAPRPQQGKVTVNSAQKKEIAAVLKGSDERSDSSSVRSASSACGSSPISPCHSPTYSGSSSEKETGPGTHCDDANSPPNPSSGQLNKYFVIKGSSQKAIDASLSKGMWVFSTSTERKLQKCLQDGKLVYLIFSVQGSGHFQGYARLTHEIVHEKMTEFCMPNSGNTYKIEWIKRANVPFQSTRHLQNPWNENRKVQISRDGQELEPSIGEGLCKLWDKHSAFVAKVMDEMISVGDSRRSTAEGSGPFPNFRQQQHHHQFAGRPIRGFQHHHSGANAVASAVSGISFHNVGRHNTAKTSAAGSTVSTSWPHKISNNGQSK